MIYRGMITYVIQNRQGCLYVGITSRPKIRIKQHRMGQSVSTSKFDKSWKYLHVWPCTNYAMASLLERHIHTMGPLSILRFIAECPTYDKLDPRIFQQKLTKLEMTTCSQHKKYFEDVKEVKGVIADRRQGPAIEVGEDHCQ